jgi:uncharacterized protein YfdQ (DUF2303 family)
VDASGKASCFLLCVRIQKNCRLFDAIAKVWKLGGICKISVAVAYNYRVRGLEQLMRLTFQKKGAKATIRLDGYKW